MYRVTLKLPEMTQLHARYLGTGEGICIPNQSQGTANLRDSDFVTVKFDDFKADLVIPVKYLETLV